MTATETLLTLTDANDTLVRARRPGRGLATVAAALLACCASPALADDCNANGIDDADEIATGDAADLNFDGVPDACQPDCNANGIPDDFETWFANGAGLIGVYYARTDFSGEAIARLDLDVDYDWAMDGPFLGWATDHFSVRWTGLLHTTVRGLYTFRLRGDEGLRLTIDGATIIDAWDAPPFIPATATIQLEADTLYPVTVEFFEGTGEASACFEWVPPGQVVPRVVPFDRLMPVADADVDGIPDVCQDVFCPGDFNKDGSVDVDDYTDYLTVFFTWDVAADTNRSGVVDLMDYFDFLGEFFTGMQTCP